MTILLLLGLCIVWALRSWMPVKGLVFLDPGDVHRIPSQASLKRVDIRDELDARRDPIPGAVNISLGRLPYVWKKELKPGEPVLLMTDNRRKSIKAARVLKRKGFAEIYALQNAPCPCPSPCYRT
ncbi:rhodanese-like domain-containing protein [Paenibacillus sp. S-38]|uniref:rhodanese-like domain-containing protein n=1 Tax=Paenibacillus sp. S-38 TaxID=3416710 RepID=UPI003CFB21A1